MHSAMEVCMACDWGHVTVYFAFFVLEIGLGDMKRPLLICKNLEKNLVAFLDCVIK